MITLPLRSGTETVSPSQSVNAACSTARLKAKIPFTGSTDSELFPIVPQPLIVNNKYPISTAVKGTIQVQRCRLHPVFLNNFPDFFVVLFRSIAAQRFFYYVSLCFYKNLI